MGTPLNAVAATFVGAAVVIFMPFDVLVEMSNAAAAIGYFIEFAGFLQLRQVCPSSAP